MRYKSLFRMLMKALGVYLFAIGIASFLSNLGNAIRCYAELKDVQSVSRCMRELDKEDRHEILDADMEINTTPPDYDFALPGDPTGDDLHMVITHEAGHFLGLNHSTLTGAVMFGEYQSGVLLSGLSDDDIAGICDIYGGRDGDPKCEAQELPSDTDCVGQSECVPVVTDEGCSCREGAPPSRAGGRWTLLGLFAWVAVIATRRRLA